MSNPTGVAIGDSRDFTNTESRPLAIQRAWLSNFVVLAQTVLA